MPDPVDFSTILRNLKEADVRFIVVGGMAMVSHGSAFVTADLDICYDRGAENIKALCRALLPFHPYLRGAPSDLPFRLDERTLRAGLNFTFVTDIGDLDLLGEILGVGGYAELLPCASEMELYGLPILIMGLDDLIRSKEVAGRDKDHIHLKELRILKRQQAESR